MPTKFAAAAVRRSVEEAKRTLLAAFDEAGPPPRRPRKARRKARGSGSGAPAAAPTPSAAPASPGAAAARSSAEAILTVTDEDRAWLTAS